jgi:hypothetical protein
LSYEKEVAVGSEKQITLDSEEGAGSLSCWKRTRKQTRRFSFGQFGLTPRRTPLIEYDGFPNSTAQTPGDVIP